MNTGQHTTGTWEVIYDHPDAKTRPAIAYIRATDRTFEIEEIALLFGCSGNPTQQANARLIAAAPELLAMVQKLKRHIACGGDLHTSAEALIAKATGEAA